jgi:hypothetical protein
MLVGLATGTAVFLTPLPMAPVPKVSAGNSWADDKKLAEIQKLLQDTVKRNREIYQLKPLLVRRRLMVDTFFSCVWIHFLFFCGTYVIFVSCIKGLLVGY